MHRRINHIRYCLDHRLTVCKAGAIINLSEGGMRRNFKKTVGATEQISKIEIEVVRE